jgi:hypothetical protein
MKSRSLGMTAKQVTVPGPDDNEKEPTRKNDVWGTRKSKTLWRAKSAAMTLLTAKSRSLGRHGDLGMTAQDMESENRIEA